MLSAWLAAKVALTSCRAVVAAQTAPFPDSRVRHESGVRQRRAGAQEVSAAPAAEAGAGGVAAKSGVEDVDAAVFVVKAGAVDAGCV